MEFPDITGQSPLQLKRLPRQFIQMLPDPTLAWLEVFITENQAPDVTIIDEKPNKHPSQTKTKVVPLDEKAASKKVAPLPATKPVAADASKVATKTTNAVPSKAKTVEPKENPVQEITPN